MAGPEELQSLEPYRRLTTTSDEMTTISTVQPQSFEEYRRQTSTLDDQDIKINDTMFANRSNNQTKSCSLVL